MDFHQRTADLIVVDDFLTDPDYVRALALEQDYSADLRFYKGSRSDQRFLWPYLREEFSRLLGKPVTRWIEYDANGVFQQTTEADPLVYHHDTQDFAAAIYLNPESDAGTSFWRDAKFGCRAKSTDPEIGAVIYDEYNLVHADNWELVESIAGLYNRLVIWNASLIHSATAYGPEPRLVQLFFFDA
jgi:hypothetical protein